MTEYFNHPYLVELFITAVVFTFVGIRFRGNKINQEQAEFIIESTIDTLIKDEMIKTRTREDGQIELLKYYEEQ